MKSIEDFKSQLIRRGGPAKGSLFRVMITSAPQPKDIGDPSGESIMFLCESASIPGRTIGTTDAVFQNNSIKIPSSFSVEDITMTFILTNDFYIKKVLEAWQNMVMDRSNYRVNFKEDYARTIEIHELDMTGKVIYAVQLYNAYPIQLNAVDVSTNGDEVLKISAAFTYEDYFIGDVTKLAGELTPTIPTFLSR